MGICCYSICAAICFNGMQSKSLEINLIVYNSISLILFLISLIIIPWDELSKANLAFFIIMFLINIICLIFSSLIRYWRAKNLIKEEKRSLGNSLSIAGSTLTIIQFILCIIEEIIIAIGISRANYPCDDRDDYYFRNLKTKIDCSGKYSDYNAELISVGESFMAYFTLSYFEIASIFEIIIWCKNKVILQILYK